MTYAYTTGTTVEHIGPLPRTARRQDTGQWVTPPADGWTPEQAASCGWLPVTEAPRPADTATATYEPTYTVTGATVTQTWTPRPWTADELAARTQVEDRIAALEATLLGTLPAPASGSEPSLAALAGRQAGAIYPGQKIRWTDGNVWRCTKGPLNSNATPATWPEGWAQETGLPAAAAWAAGQAVKIGDLRTYGGKTYRCLQAHTTQAGWEPPNVPALWALQG